MSGLRFDWFFARDAAAIETAGGVVPGMAGADWQAHEDAGLGWTAWGDDDRRWWCGGLAERVPGKVGIAWAIFAPGIGVARHLAVTRFTAKMVAASPLRRIEALVADDGRCAKWAIRCGLKLEGRLHAFDGETDVLAYARIA